MLKKTSLGLVMLLIASHGDLWGGDGNGRPGSGLVRAAFRARRAHSADSSPASTPRHDIGSGLGASASDLRAPLLGQIAGVRDVRGNRVAPLGVDLEQGVGVQVGVIKPGCFRRCGRWGWDACVAMPLRPIELAMAATAGMLAGMGLMALLQDK